MKAYREFHKSPFPPCLVGKSESPFSAHERRTASHEERFFTVPGASAPAYSEEVKDNE